MKNRINLITFYTIIAFSIILCGCGKTQFTKETHKREADFTRQFEMLACEKPYGKLCIETEDENEARKVEEFVDNCLEVAGIKPEQPKYTLYFITTFPGSQLQLADQNIFVFSKEDVINNDGVTSFERLLTHLENCDMWISCGLAGIESKVDEKALKEYYSNEDNRTQLSLSGLRFIDVFQDEEARTKAEQTAIAAVQYARKSGYKTIRDISENKTEIINGWLKSIGVDYSLEDSYEDQVAYFVGPETRKFDYILIDNLFLYILDSPYSDWEIRTPEDMEEFFWGIRDDLKHIREYIISNNVVDEETANKMVTCNMSTGSSSNWSFTHAESDTIELTAWSALPHEYTHIYFTNLNRTNHGFLDEGLAQYLGGVVYNTGLKKYAYSSLCEDNASSRAVRADNVEITENLDMRAVYHAFAKDKDFIEKNGSPLLYRDGWTYEESTDFVGFVIEKYSFDEFFKIYTCDGRDTEENEAVLQKYLDEWREDLLKN